MPILWQLLPPAARDRELVLRDFHLQAVVHATTQRKAAPKGGPAENEERSSGFKVDGLRPARITLDLETDALPFRQVAEAGALDGGDVDEYVLGSIIRRDEAKTPSGIEEFHGTSLHVRHSPDS